jgi:tripartite-type tricarboxylate transporter receptor subunit TctC
MRRLHVLAALIMACIAGFGSAGAQTYPVRTVRIIVPSSAGGTLDFVIRPIAQKMSDSLKQQFIIDNRAGANGIIGLDLTAKAPPDGYTILLGGSGHFGTSTAVNAKLPFDVMKDFAPISLLIEAPIYLMVHPSLPVKTVNEYVALAKAKPGEISYMSSGVGSVFHFLMEMLSTSAEVKLLHVPYKGTGPAGAALLAGQVMSGFDVMQSALQHVRGGRLRVLAVVAEKRSQIAPEYPTFAEAGFPGVEGGAWYALVAPANTPRDIVMTLNAEAVKALAAPEIRQAFEQAGLEVVGSSPERLADQIRRETERYVKIARQANIRAE